jgi:hypothetical protein
MVEGKSFKDLGENELDDNEVDYGFLKTGILMIFGGNFNAKGPI